MGISLLRFEFGNEGINGWERGRPNSAGGVSVMFSFRNDGEKTIKYASFGFIPYNSVGDAVGCTIHRESERFVKYTGPLYPGCSHIGGLFENAWYNNSISQVRISKVYIQYMDGTEETINGSDIHFAQGSSSSGGCYVATAIYGSYDCPEVWTLRRYRDLVLAETWYGRAFVHTYYAISPLLVKWFGHTSWFKRMWKGKLDSMVNNLQKKGYESTPYEDRLW